MLQQKVPPSGQMHPSYSLSVSSATSKFVLQCGHHPELQLHGTIYSNICLFKKLFHSYFCHDIYFRDDAVVKCSMCHTVCVEMFAIWNLCELPAEIFVYIFANNMLGYHFIHTYSICIIVLMCTLLNVKEDGGINQFCELRTQISISCVCIKSWTATFIFSYWNCSVISLILSSFHKRFHFLLHHFLLYY